MTLEKQPDVWPTNKGAAAAAVASFIGIQAEPVVREVWPQIVPAMLAGDAVTTLVAGLVGIGAGLAVAWWVPDRAGIPQ